MACTVHGVMMEVCVSVFLDMKELEKYHIVCERGTQDGISRTMGNKVIDFKDMNNEPMPAHKYDDAGIRRDGINPLTHSGYWEEEP